MTESDINKTIDNLCSELKPCCRMKSPWWRSLLWMTIAISYVVAIALMVGIQPNTMERMHQHNFVFEIAISLITGIVASIATFMLSVPDSRRMEWLYPIPMTLFLVHMMWMLIRFYIEGFGIVPGEWFSHCWMDALVMAGLPAGVVLFLIRKGATCRPRLLAINAILAVTSFSWIGMRMVCPFESVGKAYFVNFLPFMVFGVIVGFAAKKLFRW